MTADVQHSEDMLPHCHGCRLTPAAASDAASKEKGGKKTPKAKAEHLKGA